MKPITIALACITASLFVATLLSGGQGSERRDKMLLAATTALAVTGTLASYLA